MASLRWTGIFSIFLLLSLQNLAQEQKIYYLHFLSPADETNTLQRLLKDLKVKETFSDSSEINKEKNRFLLGLYDNAYLAASFDSSHADSSGITVFLNIGKEYKLARLSRGNVDEQILSETGFREKFFNNKPFRYRQIRKMQEKILDYCQNNGYPFAEIKLDSISIKDQNIIARVDLDKRQRISIDSLVVKGNLKLTPVYLHNYLGFKPGSLYNEELMRAIPNRLKELAFLTEIKPFAVQFNEDKARVYLYLDHKKSSQFDFVAGFLPDSKATGKLLFTGEAHLKLQNSIGKGEVLEVNWKSPQPLTQDLKINLLYPFLFASPFGIDAAFSLYKKDTTYIDIIKNLGLQYILSRGNYLKVFILDKQSSLIDVKRYKNQTTPPDHLDMSSFSYGLGFRSEKLDYKYNPRKGYSLTLTGSTGTRKIKQNQSLKPEVYDKVRMSTEIYSADISLDWFFPIKNRSVLNLGSKGATYISPDILSNELFRIGGLKTLRGFDEESILASTYNILKAEYRYILEQNSYLFMFYNIAYYENKGSKEYVKDTPYGFGAGITFETKLGIFSFTYALGKQFDNPIYLRSGKIHFGILSYF